MSDPLLNSAAAATQKGVGAAAAGGKQAPENVRKSAEEFEAVFLSQMLATMTQELGGVTGEGGEVYRDMFTQEIAKMISKSGGIGVADTVLQEMLKIQEID
jgi:Rod binding domain-containing protein